MTAACTHDKRTNGVCDACGHCEHDVILNGAAARLVQPGDRVIVITYGQYDETELATYEPRIVHVDERNRAIPAELAVRRAGTNLVWLRN